jgi:hypothetical protein
MEKAKNPAFVSSRVFVYVWPPVPVKQEEKLLGAPWNLLMKKGACRKRLLLTFVAKVALS